MGEFYGKKIKYGEINSKTNAPWVIDDVPKLWKKKTQDWLDSHSDKDTEE